MAKLILLVLLTCLASGCIMHTSAGDYECDLKRSSTSLDANTWGWVCVGINTR